MTKPTLLVAARSNDLTSHLEVQTGCSPWCTSGIGRSFRDDPVVRTCASLLPSPAVVNVAVGEAEAQVPPDRQHDYIRRKRNPAKVEGAGIDRRER